MKTLKDITDTDFEEYQTATVPNLRQAAIEWIKELRNDKYLYEDDNSITSSIHDAEIMIIWIMHFFNLKESDVK